jgi:RimJ/RimL family protein N-acetyltransferase
VPIALLGREEGFTIRRATPADAAALVELGRVVSSEPEAWLITDGDWRNIADERRYVRAIRRSPHAAVFVAEADGAIVGRLSLARDAHPASPHVADLGLMVAPSHRRRGIGRALLSRAVDWGRETGIEKLELHVFPHNEPAIRLYEEFGFEREGIRRAHYRRGGELVDAVLMAYHLP